MFNILQEATEAANPLGGILSLVLPIILFLVVIYFFIMRPEKKRRQQVYEMQSKLVVSDRIVTIGGIYGTIESIEDDKVTIVIASGAKMEVDKGAVKQIINTQG